MFHLTPQEKTALAAFLAICIVGATIHLTLHRNFKPVRWLNTSSRPFKKFPPNINTASALELDKVPGIGPKTAQNIVAYRKSHGPFVSLEGLKKVKGVTKKNFIKIAQYYAPGAIP